ncbi:unnamed protein product [Sphagnum balticum]
MGEYDEFERATLLIINDVQFDNDLVVSVFETNIRIVGGLLGGHFMAKMVQTQRGAMLWYTDELVQKAFTHDFQVHWGQHPLRPEFIESTYFLYRATKDPHYLQVAAQVGI